MALSIFGADLSPTTLTRIVIAMEEGYCDALRAVSFRLGGIDYVGFGSKARPLTQVIEQVKTKGGPL